MRLCRASSRTRYGVATSRKAVMSSKRRTCIGRRYPSEPTHGGGAHAVTCGFAGRAIDGPGGFAHTGALSRGDPRTNESRLAARPNERNAHASQRSRSAR